jgi:hypothetical protein
MDPALYSYCGNTTRTNIIDPTGNVQVYINGKLSVDMAV